MKAFCVGIVVVLSAILSIPNVDAIESGINIYGLSYHPDRKDSAGRKFREWNPGLGYHATLRNTNRMILFSESGLFLNSTGKSTVFSGLGIETKLHRQISIGALGALIYSPAYNSGKPLVAPIPTVSIRHNKLRFTFSYIPKYKDVNRNSAFGLSATWFVK